MIKVLQFIVSLSLLVFIHELGHYMWARFFKVRVEKFFLFFDIGIKKWDGSFCKFKPKNGHTEYGIGWLPLGGYCKIAGMIDESLDTDQMKQPEQPWEFRTKPAWKRLLIMTGGVINNFLFAILIYAGIVYCYGESFIPYKNVDMGMNYCSSAHKIGFQDGDIPLRADDRELVYLNSDEMQAMVTAKQVTVLRNHKDTVTIDIPEKFIFQCEKDAKNNKEPFIDYRIPTIVDSIAPKFGAAAAGLQKGDKLLKVDSVSTPDFKAFATELDKHKGDTVTLAFERDGKMLTANVLVNKEGRIGIYRLPINKIYHVESREYGLLSSFPRGIKEGWTTLANYVSQFKLVFSQEGAQSMGGFITMGSIFPNVWDWYSFWELTALLSVILAFMNILPIPALDGGHVMFLLYEIIFRRKPGEKFMIRAQIVGMAILFALLIWANGNDIIRLISQ